ncbi:hypothetical protein RRG08_016829 [Elysia crispata]|uniref:Uncharacterized protein n=1 Tax=Elysia crispata TaxID=231223 RepID=A0AAE0ZAD1_9GAST|nr:hypothetical protein RRG08_016829 [Elysia crispata]
MNGSSVSTKFFEMILISFNLALLRSRYLSFPPRCKIDQAVRCRVDKIEARPERSSSGDLVQSVEVAITSHFQCLRVCSGLSCQLFTLGHLS